MPDGNESGFSSNKFDELTAKIRNWLTIIFYTSALLGTLYYFLLKPASTEFRIRTLETRIETVDDLLNEKIKSMNEKMDTMLRLLKGGSNG